jgi:hypothetical protein
MTDTTPSTDTVDYTALPAIELSRATKLSTIAKKRDKVLKLVFGDPRQLEALYIAVPEVGRAIDLRAAEITRRGYEILSFDDSLESQRYAKLCYDVIEGNMIDDDSMGNHYGIQMVEQFIRNSDTYGQGYLELVENEEGNIIALEHIHPFLFGYLEGSDTNNQVEGAYANIFETSILVDENQKPISYAQYKIDKTAPSKRIVDKKIELKKVAKLSFRNIGDNLLGVSLIQRMFNDLKRGLMIKDSITDAANLTIPKMVIRADHNNEDAQRRDVESLANLAVDDVIMVTTDKEVQFIQPGETQLPDFYDIFIKGITTASSVPRPLLLADGTEVNKATMDALMKQFRESLRSEENTVKRTMRWIFKRILESYGIETKKIPYFIFPRTPEEKEQLMDMTNKRVNTLVALSNSLAGLQTVGLTKQVTQMSDILNDLVIQYKTDSNDDVTPFKIEEENEKVTYELAGDVISQPDGIPTITPSVGSETNDIFMQNYPVYDLETDLKREDALKQKHLAIHEAYNLLLSGKNVFAMKHALADKSPTSERVDVTLPMVLEKHRLYVTRMQELGIPHQHLDSMDDIHMMFVSAIIHSTILPSVVPSNDVSPRAESTGTPNP